MIESDARGESSGARRGAGRRLHLVTGVEGQAARVEPLAEDVHHRGRLSRATKRSFDVVASGLALLVLSPLLLVIGLAVGLTSRGPVLFRQIRIGRDERPFTMFKFRTMINGADDGAHRAFVTKMFLAGPGGQAHGAEDGVYKIAHDPRVTRIGAFLRRFSLDELPQLLNVLNGTMSLVGPRPALPWEADLFKPEFRPRFTVRPGITGLWQVSGRNTLTMPEALKLDLEYVHCGGLGMDLMILLRTLPAVLDGGGAR
jgi:lipopolysaccharide/colanic/teichoic acid biosynthesis glycosyltransferase